MIEPTKRWIASPLASRAAEAHASPTTASPPAKRGRGNDARSLRRSRRASDRKVLPCPRILALCVAPCHSCASRAHRQRRDDRCVSFSETAAEKDPATSSDTESDENRIKYPNGWRGVQGHGLKRSALRLDDLPADVLLMIASYEPPERFADLACIGSRWSDEVAPILWKTLREARVGGGGVRGDALDQLMARCPSLSMLDLTRCALQWHCRQGSGSN